MAPITPKLAIVAPNPTINPPITNKTGPIIAATPATTNIIFCIDDDKPCHFEITKSNTEIIVSNTGINLAFKTSNKLIAVVCPFDNV